MEKIIVFALVAVQLAAASCNSETATACANIYTACVGTGNSTETTCNCYGSYLLCLLDNTCITDSEYQNIVQTCASSGCSRQQCLGGADTPVTFTPVPSSSCDYAVADACMSTYTSCMGNATKEEICNCYGPYLYCYYYGAGCMTQNEYYESVQYCEQYGCSAQQCTSPGGPISSPVDAPFTAPYSEPDNSTCAQSAIAACFENYYQPCLNRSSTNSTGSCDCYGPYMYCLYEIQCYNITGYEQNVDSCIQYGCSYQQCANTGVTPVTDAPLGVTPIEPPTTSTSPVSAPFSAPSTVICLQPWELVLIVVGSLLAGVGLAAIIGVIIYLSRGRSSVKKSNKYAKLQQY